MREINELVVHCTATRPGWMEGRAALAKAEEIARWHTERGFAAIGYHFVIDRDGTVVNGRPLEQQGAHVRGRNARSIGVALIGGHGGNASDEFTDHFTDAQEIALRNLIDTMQSRFGPLAISGHNQYAAKACPCFDVPRWMKGKPARQSPAASTTVQATGVAGLSGAGGVLMALGQLDPRTQIIAIICATIAALALLWIVKERLRRWAAGYR